MCRKVMFLVFVGLLTVALTSCGSNKEGCPAYDRTDVKPNRNGELPTSGGNSNLFPKNMRKKM